MEHWLTGIAVIAAIVMTGVGIGVGIALGMEIVMRLTGDGRTVILTWARTRKSEKEA